jgi:hypothetical protein
MVSATEAAGGARVPEDQVKARNSLSFPLEVAAFSTPDGEVRIGLRLGQSMALAMTGFAIDRGASARPADRASMEASGMLSDGERIARGDRTHEATRREIRSYLEVEDDF